MSCIETIKSQQGYTKKPILPTCKNCKNFTFKWYHFDATNTKVWTRAPLYAGGLGYQSFQGSFRCGLKGLKGFAVTRTASCDKFE